MTSDRKIYFLNDVDFIEYVRTGKMPAEDPEVQEIPHNKVRAFPQVEPPTEVVE